MVDEEKVKKIIAKWLVAPTDEKICLLHGKDGMLAGFIAPFLLGQASIATEITWWVKPSARKKNVGAELVNAFEYWAKKLGCVYVTMSCYADNDIGDFYKSIGYELHEKAYIKEL